MRVAEDANPHGVVEAIENLRLAQNYSRKGQELFMAGQPDQAIRWLCESIVLEDSIGNLWGLVSDLGIIGEIYRHYRDYTKAEDIFVWLRLKDEQLLKSTPAAGRPKNNEPSEHESKDYHLLYGQHTEGLASGGGLEIVPVAPLAQKN